MEKTYIIRWKHKSHAASGRSKAAFTREEAEQLAEELNQDYPDIIHEPVDLRPAPSAGTAEIIAPLPALAAA